MTRYAKWLSVGLLLAAEVWLSGCATNIRQPTSSPQPAKVRFDEFKAVEMRHVAVEPQCAKGNERAIKKIDEELFSKMRFVFPELKEAAEPPEKAVERTLVIEPLIEDLKFIGGAARFWVGAMAGSSAVLMKVTYRDKATGEVIADPEFYRMANAFEGGQSIGVTDNMMLSRIADDICSYTRLNR